MDKELDELQAWLKAASSFELPPYNELPNVPLYMEQVIEYINKTLKALNPSEKDILTSFMVQRYLELYPDTVDRVILCGTNGGNGAQMRMAYNLAKLTCTKKNWDEPDKFLTNAGLGGYAKAVKNRKTDLDWLSFNEDNVNKYIADPYCGHMDTHGFWKEFLKGMVALNSKKGIKKISPKEKVLIIAGQYDPVGNNGKGPTYMANLYKKIGMKDVTLVIYPNMRHEIHNEKEHMKVYEQISEFLNK